MEHGLHLSVSVAGDGPPVVLVHGIPGSAATWEGVAAALAIDHRVLVPDLLGFGASARPPSDALGPESQARALGVSLEALDVERAVLVGGLLLCSTNVFPDTPIPFPLSTVRWAVVGPLAERVLFSRPSLAMMLRRGMGPDAPRPAPERYLGNGAQVAAIRSIFASSLRRLDERYRPIEAALRRVDAPVTVVWGDRDPFFPVAQAERTAAAARQARLVVLTGAGHFLPEERPGGLAAEIERVVAGR